MAAWTSVRNDGLVRGQFSPLPVPGVEQRLLVGVGVGCGVGAGVGAGVGPGPGVGVAAGVGVGPGVTTIRARGCRDRGIDLRQLLVQGRAGGQ